MFTFLTSSCIRIALHYNLNSETQLPNMKPTGLLLISWLSLVSASPLALDARQTPSGPCKDYHIFMARGAGDPYPGTLGGLPALVCKGVTSCDYEDILYVGTFDKVCNSVDVGVVNATQQIKSYGQRCPNAKLAVVGHSEGSATMGNTLGGGSTSFSGCTMKTTPANGPTSAAFSQSTWNSLLLTRIFEVI